MESKIEENYRLWKKNSPFLYDLIVTNSLEWPSLTVEWLKKKIAFPGKNYIEEQLVLGTHTAHGEQNYLMIANIKLPKPNIDIDSRHFDENTGELGKYGGQQAKFHISIKIKHDGEVNRARAMPQDELFIATKTISGEINIFDIKTHPSIPAEGIQSKPNLRLKGHDLEGYGLDWNTKRKGLLVSCADDSTICVFDIQTKANSSINDSRNKFKGHDGTIGDVEWHKFDAQVFGSVGEDKFLKLWDLRELGKPIHSSQGHIADINAISFSPLKESLFITGGGDNIIKLWDIRKLSCSLHNFEGHQDNIVQLQFSPHNVELFASCSDDNRVILWDISRIGEEQTTEDTEDGPSEMFFTHGGHTDKTTDFNWNKNDPWTLASVAGDNVLHVWKPSETLCYQENLAENVTKIQPKEITNLIN